MYVSIRNYQTSPGLADAFAEREADVTGLITAIEGFRAYYMIKTADGGVASISVYDDQAGAEESTRQAREWVQANMADVVTGSPEVISGEAIIDA